MLLNFLKTNMSRIMRVLANQVGVMIFALIMSMTASSMAEDLQDSMRLVASIFSICFYLFLVFVAMKEEGSRDSVPIEAGRRSFDPLHGLKIGFCATVPNYLFVLLMLIGLLIGVEYDAAANALTGSGVGVYSIGYFISAMIQSMYLGVYSSICAALSVVGEPWVQLLTFSITPLFAPLAAWLGYFYGVKHPSADRRQNKRY